MPFATYPCPDLGATCTDIQVPAVDFATCVEGMYEEESEICGIYVVKEDPANPGQPIVKPTDWTSLTDWEAQLDQSADDKIRYLPGIGDLPEPEQVVRTVSKRRKKLGNKTFNVNFDIDELNDTNREYVRSLEKGFTLFMWFETLGGGLYGGPDGIKTDVVKANLPLARGESSYAMGLIVLEWEHSCHPPRVSNPMA